MAKSKRVDEKDSVERDKLWIEDGIDLKNRIVEINDIDYDCYSIVRAIKVMERESEKPIRVIVNSSGGCVYTGLRMYDILSESHCPIITCGEGQVMSMGTIVFLAGDERYALPNTTFMCHEISSISWGKLSEQKIEVKEASRLEKICLGIMGEKTKKSAAWWGKETKHVDRFYDTKEAKKLGMITHEW